MAVLARRPNARLNSSPAEAAVWVTDVLRRRSRATDLRAGKKGVPNCCRVIPKHHEVVHLQKISAGDAHDRLDFDFRLEGAIIGP